MNVDEAMAIGRKEKPDWYFNANEAAPILTAEVERLRAECERLRAEVEMGHSFHRVAVKERDFERLLVESLKEELAAAKAASVVPVEAIDCYFDAFANLGVVRVLCKSGEDARKVTNWLRDRMKERGDG